MRNESPLRSFVRPRKKWGRGRCESGEEGNAPGERAMGRETLGREAIKREWESVREGKRVRMGERRGKAAAAGNGHS